MERNQLPILVERERKYNRYSNRKLSFFGFFILACYFYGLDYLWLRKVLKWCQARNWEHLFMNPFLSLGTFCTHKTDFENNDEREPGSLTCFVLQRVHLTYCIFLRFKIIFSARPIPENKPNCKLIIVKCGRKKKSVVTNVWVLQTLEQFYENPLFKLVIRTSLDIENPNCDYWGIES